LTEAVHFQSKLVEIEELALIKELGKSKPKPKPARKPQPKCEHGRRTGR
jgi:hypothetical protein